MTNSVYGLQNEDTLPKRSRIEIMANILELAQVGIRKTNLLYRSNLSFHRLNIYLKLLLETGLLEENENRKKIKLFQTTGKGREFVVSYKQLAKALKAEKLANNTIFRG